MFEDWDKISDFSVKSKVFKVFDNHELFVILIKKNVRSSFGEVKQPKAVTVTFSFTSHSFGRRSINSVQCTGKKTESEKDFLNIDQNSIPNPWVKSQLNFFHSDY